MTSDVCLLLEGTYPYVAGGVSTWVYDLIRKLPDVTFSIVFLGPHRMAYRRLHYEIPDNVVEFREYFLFDYQVTKEKLPKPTEEDYEVVYNFLMDVKKGKTDSFEQILNLIGNPNTRKINLHDLVHDELGWRLVERMYQAEKNEVSFVDFFWTWRFLYLPFFSLLRINMPKAHIYHAVSTGYAGALGALAKINTKRPYILTEHGIYTRERKIEISKADWIYSESANEIKVVEGKDFFRQWWIQLFSFLSNLSYQWSDEIITLHEGNRKVQIEEGAPAEKIKIIPNGFDLTRLRAADPVSKPVGKKRIGLVGRVVPIKDIKTFIKACRRIADEIKDVEILIMGPTDEDEEYYHECLFLTEMEGLQHEVHFTGKVKVSDYYPTLDVMVLTSISESQPIVILEAMANGVPCVSTDVGACRELLYGRTPDDQLLGQSGIVTPICDPDETAQAVIDLIKNPTQYEQMSTCGKQRIIKYYQMDDLIANYQVLYSQYSNELDWPVAEEV